MRLGELALYSASPSFQPACSSVQQKWVGDHVTVPQGAGSERCPQAATGSRRNGRKTLKEVICTVEHDATSVWPVSGKEIGHLLVRDHQWGPVLMPRTLWTLT